LGVLAFLREAFVVFNELDVKTEAVKAISGGDGAIIVNRHPAEQSEQTPRVYISVGMACIPSVKEPLINKPVGL
jgi:hypothetical protein